MATWKKVIVSGSTAELLSITSSNGVLVGTNQRIGTTQATTSLTGSFTGSFTGDGQFLTNVTATAVFPTLQVTNITSTDKFFISQSNNQYITYGDLLTDLAGTNLIVEGTDSLALSSNIVVTTVTASAGFTGSLTGALTGTASQAENANLLDNQHGSFYQNASNINAGTIGNAYLPAAISVTSITASAGFTGSLTGALIGTASWATNATNTITATNATNTAITDTTSGTGPYYVTFVDGTTGNRAQLVDSNGLTFNATTNTLTVTASYANQSLSSSFATLAATATSATNATNIAVTDTTTGTGPYYVTFVDATTGNVAQRVDSTGLTYNATSNTLTVTSSFATAATSASYAGSVNNISNAITSNTDNYLLTATGGGTINGESTLTYDGTTLTVGGNASITGNLTVAGTASFTNTDNLTIRDKFILINSGSSTLADSGWITQYNAAGSGSAFYLEAGAANNAGPYGRFAVAFDVIGTSTSLTPSEYVVTAKIDQASAPTTAVPPTWGTGSSGAGNMWIMNNAAGDIYIYS